jgi:hypothetical protein
LEVVSVVIPGKTREKYGLARVLGHAERHRQIPALRQILRASFRQKAYNML